MNKWYQGTDEQKEYMRERQRIYRAEQKIRMENDPEYAEKIRLKRVSQRQKQLEKNPDYYKEERVRRLERDPDLDRKKNANKHLKIKADPRLTKLRAETIRRHKLKVKYGMTVEDFDRMWLAQDGICAICPRELEEGYKTHVDHCHDTGKVRGLLCFYCNTALGKLNEDESTILSMLDYVRKHKTKDNS